MTDTARPEVAAERVDTIHNPVPRSTKRRMAREPKANRDTSGDGQKAEAQTGMDGPAPKAKLVHQYPGSWCGVPTIVGRYMVQSVPDIHGFIVLDISDGDRPVEVSRLVVGADFDAHWTAWDPKSRRLAVTPGKPGQRMYLLKLDETSGALTIDEAFRGPDDKPGFSLAK